MMINQYAVRAQPYGWPTATMIGSLPPFSLVTFSLAQTDFPLWAWGAGPLLTQYVASRALLLLLLLLPSLFRPVVGSARIVTTEGPHPLCAARAHNTVGRLSVCPLQPANEKKMGGGGVSGLRGVSERHFE